MSTTQYDQFLSRCRAFVGTNSHPQSLIEVCKFERDHHGMSVSVGQMEKLTEWYRRHGKTCRAVAIDAIGDIWFFQTPVIQVMDLTP